MGMRRKSAVSRRGVPSVLCRVLLVTPFISSSPLKICLYNAPLYEDVSSSPHIMNNGLKNLGFHVMKDNIMAWRGGGDFSVSLSGPQQQPITSLPSLPSP